MFIRTKKTPRNSNVSVQLVESYRDAGRMRQRVVRHIGTAKTEEKLAELKQVALAIKAEIEHRRFEGKAEKIATLYGNTAGKLCAVSKQDKLPLLYTKEVQRQILGIHDVYGLVYEIIGFTNPFPCPKRREHSSKILREIVLGRIASPRSKRSTVGMLHKDFGVELNLDHVYQMMDKIDDVFCERIQKNALAATLRLTGEKLKVLFYDATTLYFESFTEDDLKQNGYSKDMKFNQSQVLLALFVTHDGLPVGYELFPGATYEGHTLKPVLEKLKKRYQIDEMVFVADRGMLSADNLDYLEKNNIPYIVGARIRSLNKSNKKNILAWSVTAKDSSASNTEHIHRMHLGNKKTIILSYDEKRARKDEHDREKAIAKLQKKLSKSKNPKTVVSNYGYQKFLSIEGNAQLKINKDKLNEEAKWDGLAAVYTNHASLSNKEILGHYRSLWQVEESFRITKHDLKIRPIYHWSEQRVKAHIAISFMAFACVRHLEYRVRLQYKKLSPEAIRQALVAVQASIIKNEQNGKSYLLPSKASMDAKQIYRAVGAKIVDRAQRIL